MILGKRCLLQIERRIKTMKNKEVRFTDCNALMFYNHLSVETLAEIDAPFFNRGYIIEDGMIVGWEEE